MDSVAAEEKESPRKDDQNEFPSLSPSFELSTSEDVFLADFEAECPDKAEDDFLFVKLSFEDMPEDNDGEDFGALEAELKQ